MDCICSVYFEEPFWIALFECWDEEGYSVCRTVFGAQPNEAELLAFALSQYYQLNFSTPMLEKTLSNHPKNFKRQQRENRQFMKSTQNNKRAWQAIQEEFEQRKTQRQEINHQEKETAERETYLIRQQKKKEKHRGR